MSTKSTSSSSSPELASVVLVETESLSSRSSSLLLLPRIDSDFWRLNLPRGTVPRVTRWGATRPAVDIAFSAPLTDRFRFVPALTKVLEENMITSSSLEEGGEGWWEVMGVGIWEYLDEESCLEGRRRRLMRRGTRATREGDGGERGEGREAWLSFWFVAEKALLLVAVAVWVVVFLGFVCLGKAIPVQRRAATFSFSRSLARSPAASSLQNRCFRRKTSDPLRPPVHQQSRRERESEDRFRRRLLLVVVGIRCLFNFLSWPSHKQPKTTGATERT